MFTVDQAADAVVVIGVHLEEEMFDLEDVLQGMEVELEHGTRFPDLDVTGDDPVVTAKIALAHLREFPDYYRRLAVMEREAEAARALEVEEDPGIV